MTVAKHTHARTFPSLTSTHRARASRSRSSAVSLPCSPPGREREKGGVAGMDRRTGRGEEGLQARSDRCFRPGGGVRYALQYSSTSKPHVV